jgi:uncharacterized circularly permuted ATP-grasp superfamily protein
VTTELHAAIDAYHAGLTPALAEESEAWLTARLADRAMMFGDRPLCTVVRPRFLTRDGYLRIQRAGAAIGRAFTRAHAAAMARPEVLAQFRLTDWELTLLAGEDGLPVPSPLGRYDAFFSADGTGLKFTENNAETPAGSAYGDVLAELFMALPGLKAFRQLYDVRTLPSRPSMLQTLLECFHAATGRRDLPMIGIIDWREVPTQSEFAAFKAWFESLGLKCIIADPRELEYRGGKLRVGPTVIDLIYKRVLIHELVEREGLMHPMVRAVRDRAVVMVNPFRCKVLHKKASLAVLSDERNAGLFDERMLQAIAAHIPWTRVVERRRTEWQGRDVDLLECVAGNRERFVLKPNDDYGGTGIVLGWEVDDATWQRAVAAAVDAPSVVQERIHQPSELFPAWIDGKLVVSDRIVDTAPYVFGGAYVDGCLSRISTAALVNVTSGGGSTLPTFVVERRQ